MQIRDWVSLAAKPGGTTTGSPAGEALRYVPSAEEVARYIFTAPSNSASVSPPVQDADSPPATSSQEQTIPSSEPDQKTSKPEHHPSPGEASSPEVEAIATHLVRTLESFGVGVDLQGVALAPAFFAGEAEAPTGGQSQLHPAAQG